MQPARGGALLQYLRIAEISLKNRVVYLADHLAGSIFLILILFIFSQLWKTVLGAGGDIAGLDGARMLWYMVFTEVIALSTPGSHTLVSEEVKSGDLAYKLVRPYSYTLYYFAAHCGEFLIRFITNLTVGATFAYLAMGPLAVEWATLGWVLLGFALSVAINFLVCFALALMAFWLEDNRPFFWILNKMVFIFGGLFVPVEAYPEGLRRISYLLPLRYGFSAPARLVVRFDYPFLRQMLAGQLIWVTVLAVLVAAMFRKGVRRVHVHGG
ncbi:MAG: ABC transporter permease [Limnochordia bacterium]|jgi:ABC-2 type transport system permease protein